jgi:hypothetical protein
VGIRTTDTGRRKFLAWECHRRPTPANPLPACAYEDILAAAAAIPALARCITLPRVPRQRKPAPIDPEALAALALSGMQPMSLKLAMLEMAGVGTREALDKLGVRREHRSRVINGRAPIRVQNRR